MCRSGFHGATLNDASDLNALAKDREAKEWDDMPQETKRRYLIIARSFPGVQLYACGSRVTGRYADKGDEVALAARKKAGNGKPESDYDFQAPPNVKPLIPLPWWADRVQMPVHGIERVAIPVHGAKKKCQGCK